MTALAKTARKISDSDEKDKSSTNFIHTPKTVIGGSGENLDNQSVTLSVEKHEGNGEDNYVVMDTSIVLEMEITPEKPLITLSSTNQPENTSFKPKQTFAKEPQFQEINRGDNNKSVNKTYPISMDAGERFEPQKKPFYSQVRSKYSPSTFSPPQELRAIDRIRLGPYSRSIRSPKDKSSTPRKTPSKTIIMELKNSNENIVTAESNISKTNGSMLKAVSDQNISSYVKENSVQDTSLNEVNSFAEPTGQEESSIEQQNKVLVEKSLTDTKPSAVIATTSNDKPVSTATSINSNNIVISTTPVSPSSSKSDGNDIILDKVVVHSLTD
ncbi:hypothetical protein RRG08_050049 [Elysia crispata]|uniref:Uncharacterized protein n=1 Tax=Elysia crispata TaxID=231223 RepID=A0AAE1B9J3_9GAST|nr:hypothetical protein RRG08_050049 [Elysia crispata]